MATFWQRLKGLFTGDAPKSAGNLLASILQGGQMPRRGTRELLLAYARLPWVHSVVKRISSDVAGVPLRLYRVRRAGAKDIRRTAPGPIRKAMVQDATRAGDLEPIDNHPLLELWRTWNPALGGHASRMALQAWLDLVGEGFAVKERNQLGQPLELWPIPPHWIADTPSAASPAFRASYMGWNRLLPEPEVLWCKMPNPENPYARGTGLGEALGDELDIDEASTKLLRNWFFNSAIPPVIINLPETGPEEAERFKERVFAEHGGPTKANRLMVTNALTMDVKQLTPTFKEQEIPELRAAAKEIVVQVFNVPPECMGIIENSNRATIDAADYLYTKGVLCPRLDFLVAALEPLLADYGDESLVLDYVSPVAEDKEYKRQVFLQAPAGTFTRNEYRALAGETPVEEEEKPGEPISQYHLQFRIVTINEARARLGLPPMEGGDEPPKPPDLFGLGGEEMAAGRAVARSRLVLPDPGPVACPACGAEPGCNIDCRACLAYTSLKAQRRALPAAVRKAVNIERILEALRPERLTDEAGPVFERRIQKWGNRALRELGISASFSMKNPLIREHLETLAGKKITGLVMETTRQAIRDTLAEGVAAGEGIELLSSRVMDVFDVADKVRARRIARTEVVGSSNLTNLAAFQQSGVVARKEWLSVRDGNTRIEHQELDGQTTGVMESFSVPGSGERAQHPGGFGVAALDINCRCSVLPVVDDAKGLELGPLVLTRAMSEEEKAMAWKRYDKRLLPWEREVSAALRRGFREQESDVLEALESLA
jgi:SPP1 gp7 family putative phage head morphogenesis protein